MTDFTLDERLKQDTIEVMELEISKILLMNDKRFPWLILVPKVDRKKYEIIHLTEEERNALYNEIDKVSSFMEERFIPTSLNVGKLGNIVDQLHIHIIARFDIDDAWPGPCWGYEKRIPYEQKEINVIEEQIKDYFK